jgi:hypothetical protein
VALTQKLCCCLAMVAVAGAQRQRLRWKRRPLLSTKTKTVHTTFADDLERRHQPRRSATTGLQLVAVSWWRLLLALTMASWQRNAAGGSARRSRRSEIESLTMNTRRRRAAPIAALVSSCRPSPTCLPPLAPTAARGSPLQAARWHATAPTSASFKLRGKMYLEEKNEKIALPPVLMTGPLTQEDVLACTSSPQPTVAKC